MKYLVTGCAGFIGSNVAEQLLAAGHDVVGLDDLNDAYDPTLKAWRLDQIARRPRFRFERGSLLERDRLDALFRQEGFDAILNLAARAGVRQSLLDPWVYIYTNVTGTVNLLELARRNDVRRVLLASTSSLYGAHNSRPFREDANTDRPLSPYAASKKAAEAHLATYAHLYGLDAPVCRYFTVYGPAGRPDMSVFRFVRWIAEGEPIVVYGDGSQERDFTYVTDIARGTIAASTKVRGFEIVNLGSDHPVKLSDIIHMIEERVGRKAIVERRPFHPADVHATWADIGKARAVLGWAPETAIAEGIAHCVEWYLKNREWAARLDIGPT